jgi:hypothetical protein
MPQPFHPSWLRRHPLTTLLLVATVSVNAVVIVLDLERDAIARPIVFAFLVSQLSLLAWWTTADKKVRLKRLPILTIAVVWCAYTYSISTDLLPGLLTFVSLHAIVVGASSWTCWQCFGPTLHTPKCRTQFSLLQLLGAMTLCAVLAALYQHADFTELVSDSEVLVALSGATILGIASPGLVFLSRYPLRIRWSFPFVLGFIFTIVETELVSADNQVFCIINGVSAAVYSIWGLCIGVDAGNQPAEPSVADVDLRPERPRCDSPGRSPG